MSSCAGNSPMGPSTTAFVSPKLAPCFVKSHLLSATGKRCINVAARGLAVECELPVASLESGATALDLKAKSKPAMKLLESSLNCLKRLFNAPKVPAKKLNSNTKVEASITLNTFVIAAQKEFQTRFFLNTSSHVDRQRRQNDRKE
jgi:hypothetical protein